MPGAGVLHRQRDTRPRAISCTVIASVGRRELHRVREQVPDHLLQTIRIALRQRRPDVDVRLETAAAWPAPPAARCRPRCRRWPPDRPARTCSRSLPVTMREISSRSSISRACARAFRSMLSSARCLRGWSAPVDAQDPRPAEHRVERRPQFVRQRREELVLQSVGVALALERGDAFAFDALAFVHLALQLGVGFRQLRRPIGDVVEHVVEGADHDADLVAGAASRGSSNRGSWRCARAVSASCEERLGDRSLHAARREPARATDARQRAGRPRWPLPTAAGRCTSRRSRDR